jgi:hypothetical protein
MHSNECRIVNTPREVKILPIIFVQNSVIGLAVFSFSQNTGWELEVWVLGASNVDTKEQVGVVDELI